MLWCCEPRPVFSDPPCFGGKSLEAGTVSQAVPRHCPAWSLLALQHMGSFLGCLCQCETSVHPEQHSWHVQLYFRKDFYFHGHSRSVCESPLHITVTCTWPFALPSWGGGWVLQHSVCVSGWGSALDGIHQRSPEQTPSDSLTLWSLKLYLCFLGFFFVF